MPRDTWPAWRRAKFFQLDDAPVFEALIPAPIEGRQLTTVVSSPLTVPMFGLTADDIAEGRRLEFERCERLAWSMLRQCPCGRWFLPARRNCTACCREHYLRHYRKREAKRYQQYTRRWRAKISAGR